jgi:hypothetical protein
MKWLCSLLALLVLILSVQPACADLSSIASNTCADSCCTGSAAEQDMGKENDRKKECAHGCNPFQVCGCCAFSVVPPVLLIAPLPQPDFGLETQKRSSLSALVSDQLASGIWQPPRAA